MRILSKLTLQTVLNTFNRSAIKTAMEGDFDTGNMRFKGSRDIRSVFLIGVECWHSRSLIALKNKLEKAASAPFL